MTIRQTQVCDRCGKERPLPHDHGTSKPEIGGWRTLKLGSIDEEFCGDCIKAMRTQAPIRLKASIMWYSPSRDDYARGGNAPDNADDWNQLFYYDVNG